MITQKNILGNPSESKNVSESVSKRECYNIILKFIIHLFHSSTFSGLHLWLYLPSQIYNIYQEVM